MTTNPGIGTISHDWIQCSDCQWIGKTETAVLPHMGGLLGCPACSNISSIEEYHGKTSVEIPVDLLSDVLAKLGTAGLMLGNPHFPPGAFTETERECVQVVWEHLFNFMVEQGIRSRENEASSEA